MVGIIVGFVFVVGGTALFYYSRGVVEKSMRPGSRWIIRAAWRLPLLRVIGAFYVLIGFLIAYAASHS